MRQAEARIPDGADYYLQVAAEARAGIFERGDPWGSGYSTIDYVKVSFRGPSAVGRVEKSVTVTLIG